MYKYVKNGIIAKYQLLREKFRKWYEIEFISAEKPLYRSPSWKNPNFSYSFTAFTLFSITSNTIVFVKFSR